MNETTFDRANGTMLARRFSRRAVMQTSAIGLAAGTLGAAGVPVSLRGPRHASAQASTPGARANADHIIALAEDNMTRSALRAIILRVTIDGEELVTAALGESLTGEPATPEMKFRNGAVAISYMTTLLLQFVDRGVVGLDDPIDRWMPELPEASLVTLRMLANMTAGYPDYVPNEQFLSTLYADPFRGWTSEELIEIGTSTPRLFAPGTNWDYSHTDYVILGRALERIGDGPLASLLQENVLDPLGLSGTTSSTTSDIPDPVLHAYSSERRWFLDIDPSDRFYEESTFWNPTWTLAEGAVQTTTIYDMTATAEAIGTGALLSEASHRARIGPDLLGFGAPLESCRACHTLEDSYYYGLGVVLAGKWILQNPLFGGYGAIEAYLPDERIAIAVATTFGEEAFDEQGTNLHDRASWEIFAAIGAYLAPDDAQPGS